MVECFIQSFITIRFLDIIDILLVAMLFYLFYNLIKGTAAVNIFIGIFAIFIIWKIVKAFQMELLSEIIGQFISVGVIALVIVFQPEIRQFLLLLGTPRFFKRRHNPKRLFNWAQSPMTVRTNDIESIVSAVENMSNSKTGALIILAKKSSLNFYVETGDLIDASITSRLLESIFYKNSPLHDGAVIITSGIIKAARCVLPISEDADFPGNLGLRHRAAMGISEKTDAIALVVSEQTSSISLCQNRKLQYNITPEKLKKLLYKEYSVTS